MDSLALGIKAREHRLHVSFYFAADSFEIADVSVVKGAAKFSFLVIFVKRSISLMNTIKMQDRIELFSCNVLSKCIFSEVLVGIQSGEEIIVSSLVVRYLRIVPITCYSGI